MANPVDIMITNDAIQGNLEELRYGELYKTGINQLFQITEGVSDLGNGADPHLTIYKISEDKTISINTSFTQSTDFENSLVRFVNEYGGAVVSASAQEKEDFITQLTKQNAFPPSMLGEAKNALENPDKLQLPSEVFNRIRESARDLHAKSAAPKAPTTILIDDNPDTKPLPESSPNKNAKWIAIAGGITTVGAIIMPDKNKDKGDKNKINWLKAAAGITGLALTAYGVSQMMQR